MARRLAIPLALLVFALCLVAGMYAGNSFAETVQRALTGMAGTLVVGLVVGAMGQKMLEEHVSELEKKGQFSEAKASTEDR